MRFTIELPKITVLLCLLFLVTGCAVPGSSDGTADADWKEFSVEATARHDGYRIRYPKDWILEPIPDGFGAVLSSAEGADAALIVGRTDKVRTPMEVAKSIETLQKMGTPGAEAAISHTLLSGHEAVRVDVENINISRGSFVPQGAATPGQEGSPGHLVEVFADGPKSRFNLSYTVLKGDRATQELLEQMIERFVVE